MIHISPGQGLPNFTITAAWHQSLGVACWMIPILAQVTYAVIAR
jgi:hypothetical protein